MTPQTYTLRDKRRLDRLERAVSGYTDEGGVFVVGLLQTTADSIALIKTLRRIGYGVLALQLANAFHTLYGVSDIIRVMFEGSK